MHAHRPVSTSSISTTHLLRQTNKNIISFAITSLEHSHQTSSSQASQWFDDVSIQELSNSQRESFSQLYAVSDPIYDDDDDSLFDVFLKSDPSEIFSNQQPESAHMQDEHPNDNLQVMNVREELVIPSRPLMALRPSQVTVQNKGNLQTLEEPARSSTEPLRNLRISRSKKSKHKKENDSSQEQSESTAKPSREGKKYLTKHRKPKRNLQNSTKKDFITNNLLPHTRTSIHLYLKRSEQGLKLLKIKEINDLFYEEVATLTNLNLILNHTSLSAQLTEMFSSRFLYRRLMESKAMSQKKLDYLKYLDSFELAFMNGILEDLSDTASEELRMKKLLIKAAWEQKYQANKRGEDNSMEKEEEKEDFVSTQLRKMVKELMGGVQMRMAVSKMH